MKKILFGIMVIALVACTVKFGATINFSDLISDTNKTVIADLRVSVPSCSDENVQNIQAELEKRNIRANFNKCSSDELWNDYANFSFPITIVKESDAPDSDIYFQYKDNNFYIKTSNRFATLLNTGDDMFADKISISGIEFYLVNDTNDAINLKTYLAFVDEKPVYDKTIEVKSYNKVLIKLPDVVSKLMENSAAEYMIFSLEK